MYAVNYIIKTIMESDPQTITLVPTGPLTNIALACRLEPRIVERVKEVVLMGGGYHSGVIGCDFIFISNYECDYGKQWRFSGICDINDSRSCPFRPCFAGICFLFQRKRMQTIANC